MWIPTLPPDIEYVNLDCISVFAIGTHGFDGYESKLLLAYSGEQCPENAKLVYRSNKYHNSNCCLLYTSPSPRD